MAALSPWARQIQVRFLVVPLCPMEGAPTVYRLLGGSIPSIPIYCLCPCQWMGLSFLKTVLRVRIPSRAMLFGPVVQRLGHRSYTAKTGVRFTPGLYACTLSKPLCPIGKGGGFKNHCEQLSWFNSRRRHFQVCLAERLRHCA